MIKLEIFCSPVKVDYDTWSNIWYYQTTLKQLYQGYKYTDSLLFEVHQAIYESTSPKYDSV